MHIRSMFRKRTIRLQLNTYKINFILMQNSTYENKWGRHGICLFSFLFVVTYAGAWPAATRPELCMMKLENGGPSHRQTPAAEQNLE